MPGPQRRDASGNPHPDPPQHHPHKGGGHRQYVNPIGKGLITGRIDEGVDFSGAGDLFAMGDGVIKGVQDAGWPGGVYILLHMDDGRDVYYAEDIRPHVQVGQRVKAGEKIGYAFGGGSGIEVGWATGTEGEAAASGHYSEGDRTHEGRDFAALLGNFGVDVPGAANRSTMGASSSGGGGGTPTVLQSGKPQTVKQYLDDPQIAQTYGYLAAYLHNKQIGPILAKAAKHGWGQDELLGALEKTKWWKNTAESTRSWEAQKRLDPATAHQRLDQMRQQIQQLALSTLGSHLDPNRAAHMANAALSANWNQAQLQAAIGAEFHYQGAQAKYKGAAGQTVDQLQQLSSQYLVPLGHQAMQHWGRQILEGSTTVADYTSYLQAQAESLFPTLTHALNSGQTVAQFADPYLQMASQILEKPTGEFNLLNPKWGKALSSRQPNGQRAPMSLPAWGDYLRSLPEYKTTQQAQQQGAAFSNSLLNIFGKVSTPSSAPSAAGG